MTEDKILEMVSKSQEFEQIKVDYKSLKQCNTFVLSVLLCVSLVYFIIYY